MEMYFNSLITLHSNNIIRQEVYLLKKEKGKGKHSLLENLLSVNKEDFQRSTLLNNTVGRKYYYCHF